MAKIAILRTDFCPFEGDQYEVDTSRVFEGYESGDLMCYVKPFFNVPLTLELAIRKNGDMIFRNWSWNSRGNNYLHTDEKPDKFTATEEQIDTVNGLFSGRILFEGLKISVGASIQNICPIDVEKEEKLVGKKIYLN